MCSTRLKRSLSGDSSPEIILLPSRRQGAVRLADKQKDLQVAYLCKLRVPAVIAGDWGIPSKKPKNQFTKILASSVSE